MITKEDEMRDLKEFLSFITDDVEALLNRKLEYFDGLSPYDYIKVSDEYGINDVSGYFRRVYG